jgi:hypothetical protein
VPLGLLVAAAPGTASGADVELGAGAPTIAIHGFVSPGFLVTLENDYLADATDTSFEFVEVGINFTASLTDDLRVGLQLFARDLGPRGNYTPRIDWFYLDYRFTDWFGIRAGRTKLPFGLYNEVNDIDAARVPILLPQSVYPITNRDLLLAQTGIELYGYFAFEEGGALDYRLYVGTIFFDEDSSASRVFDIEELKVPYVVGGRLMWETPVVGLRVGGSIQAIRLDTQLTVPGPPPVALEGDVEALLWVVSLEAAITDTLFAAEYSRWHVQTSSTAPQLFPEVNVTSERAHVMLWHRIDWFTPGLTYSLLFSDVDDRSGRAQRQHDVAVTLRFDVNEYWLVKLEGHYMNGTAAVDPELNGGKPRSELAEHWAVFLVKTTAYF